MFGLIGEKLGMSQRFTEHGDMVPVTVIKCGPCVVVQKKVKDNEGYDALQLAYKEIKKVQNVNRARKGHFQKAKTPMFRHLGECRLNETVGLTVGDTLGVEVFQVGDRLSVRGRTKGRGFQGVFKRHGKHGGGAAHGSCFHRSTGSIGQNSSPARVIKNMGMPGHMGFEYRTAKNVEVVEVDVENNLLFVRGSIPGVKSGIVKVVHPTVNLKDRCSKKEEIKEEVKKDKEESEKVSDEARS